MGSGDEHNAYAGFVQKGKIVDVARKKRGINHIVVHADYDGAALELADVADNIPDPFCVHHAGMVRQELDGVNRGDCTVDTVPALWFTFLHHERHPDTSSSPFSRVLDSGLNLVCLLK